MARHISLDRAFMRWFGAAAICLITAGSHILAQDQPAETGDASGGLAPFTFTAGQAVGGKANFQRLCAECHGNALEGTQAPALSGPSFSHWMDAPVSDLFDFIQQQMPAGAGGTLTDAQVATIITHIAKVNGMTAGTEALPTNPDELGAIQFGQ